MFQNLRKGQSLYVLYKSEPRVEIAEVDTVGVPTPQFSATNFSQSQYMQPKNTIDIKVKIGDQVIDLQKLPADSDIADFAANGMVISTNRDCILAELETMRTSSLRILDSIDKHKGNVDACTKLIEDLNPQLKQEAERNKEIDGLKSEIATMKDMLSKILEQQK